MNFLRLKLTVTLLISVFIFTVKAQQTGGATRPNNPVDGHISGKVVDQSGVEIEGADQDLALVEYDGFGVQLGSGAPAEPSPFLVDKAGMGTQLVKLHPAAQQRFAIFGIARIGGELVIAPGGGCGDRVRRREVQRPGHDHPV